MNTVETGRFIASRRKKMSLTQKELAEKLNVTDKAVSKWETGKGYPDIEIIVRLGDVLGVSVNEILSGRIIEPENQAQEADKNVVSIMKDSKNNKNKWKIVTFVLSLVTVLAVVFVVFQGVGDVEKPHQLLTDTQAEFDSKTSMRISVSEIGLENVLIRQLEAGVKLSVGERCTVYLLADNRYKFSDVAADYYLVVSTQDKIVAKDLLFLESGVLGANFSCADIDADGDEEIIMQENIALSGGAGQYLSRVFDFKNGELVELFSSANNGRDYDTGFSFAILEDRKFKIENRFTGYAETFTLPGRDDEYYSSWYDENGKPQSLEMMVDTFSEFEPYDVDGDGAYEIKCRQYTSLKGHSDFIGTAVSVLKYNKDTAEFEVYYAYFAAEIERVVCWDLTSQAHPVD